jgi:fucose permease
MVVQTTSEPGTRARTAPLFGAYLVFGIFWGVWVVVFADFLAAHRMSEGAAGLRLAALSVTAVLTMTLVAPRLQRLPLSVTVSTGLGVFALGALLVAFPSGAAVALGFAAIGVGNGLIDVFVNVGGQLAEARSGRPVLQYLHASYNVGGIIGAVAAGAMRAGDVSYRVPLAVSATLFVVAALWSAASRALRERPAPTRGNRSRTSLSVFLVAPFLILPAVVILCAFTVEGSMDIWSVIYLRRTLEATAFAGAIAFAAFSAAMAVGRITAARVLFGLGYRTTLRVSGVGTVIAGLLAAIAPNAALAGVGFLFLGFFMAAAAPAAFGLAGRSGVDPVVAIAGMTTVGYAGFVLGPPIMGWLAEGVGLRATMVALVTVGIGIAVGGLLAPADGDGTSGSVSRG